MTHRREYISTLLKAAASLAGFFPRLGLFDAGSSGEEIRGYWRAYGGIPALARSPAVWASLGLTILCTPYWYGGNWQELITSVVPNLLGFTLGAMAVILAFPSSKQLFRIFQEDGAPDSYYIDLASKFVHFILVQVAAIVFSFIGRAYPCFPASFIGFFLLCYAILCAAMTGLALFGVAQLINHPGAASLLDDDKSTE